MAYDWFVVPLESVPEADGGPYTRPKYSDQVDSFSGNWQTFDADKYSDLPWYPEDRYVVRFYADDATLDAIYSNGDAYALYRDPDVTESDVAEYLNDINDANHTFAEWEQSFLVE